MNRIAKLIALSLSGLATFAGCSGDEGESPVDSDESEVNGAAYGPAIPLRDTKSSALARPNPQTRPGGGWIVTPIHATLLPNGNVLVTGWGRADEKTCRFPEGSRDHGLSFVLDPAQLTKAGPLMISPIDEAPAPNAPGFTADVLYCAGHVPVVVNNATTVLHTGGSRYINLGGKDKEREEGLAYARSFDVSQNRFSRLASPMLGGPKAEAGPDGKPFDRRGARWYPTNTRLPDGRVLVSGGFTGGPTGCCNNSQVNLSLEVFDPRSGKFDLLVQHEEAPPIADLMAPGLKDYTHTFLLPEPVTQNGIRYDIAMMGWRGRFVFATTDKSAVASARFFSPSSGARPDGAPGWDSTAVLLPPRTGFPSGELMVIGGSNNRDFSKRIDFYNPVNGSWRKKDAGIGRRNAAAVLMADGRVFISNGYDEDTSNLIGDRRIPQVYDPETDKLTNLDAWTDGPERGYHSVAVLLKDGRILLGGGTSAGNVSAVGCEQSDVRIFTPPYLRTTNPRPVVSGVEPAAMRLGGAAVSFGTSGGAVGAKSAVRLVALGSTTHSFDQNQRSIPLEYVIRGTQIEVRPPKNGNSAPPGDYLMFVMSDKGVPSLGKHVRVE